MSDLLSSHFSRTLIVFRFIVPLLYVHRELILQKCVCLIEKTFICWFIPDSLIYWLRVLVIVDLLFGEGNGTPLKYCCLENPMDGGAWWAVVHGVARSRTRLK